MRESFSFIPSCTLVLFYLLKSRNSLLSYDIFAINIASVMIGYVYSPGQKTTPNQDLGLKVATPVGTLVGQLLFGWLADVVGRKRMCMSFQISNSDYTKLSYYQS